MKRRVLITGGAGFIGSHIAERLLTDGHEVRVLDRLLPQVHPSGDRPAYLAPDVELIVGDIRDADIVTRALRGVDAVIHLAAAVGVGQSMYEMAAYTGINDLGTAVLLEALGRNPVERLVTASSMSIYGEGLAARADGGRFAPPPRRAAALRERDWELCDAEGTPLRPLPTPETKPADPLSVYALTKYMQERLTLVAGAAYGIPSVALRLFNVYGPNQALSNPYTGVLAIFAARLVNGRPPMIFEDGRQRRDFVHVRDVARAFALALERTGVSGVAVNIGSGTAHSIISVAQELAAVMGRNDIAPRITGKFRSGDVRHCFADTSLAGQVLGYRPQITFRQGLAELAGWFETQIATDRVAEATAELEARGLVA